MTDETIQLKLLAGALELNRRDIAAIIALGGIRVSKSRVDSWLRGRNATKNVTGNRQRPRHTGTVTPEEFHAFCVGLKPWLDRDPLAE